MPFRASASSLVATPERRAPSPPDRGRVSLTLKLRTSDSDGGKKTGEALQSMLETQLPGLKLTVTSVPFKTRLARRENCEFQICGSDWIADFADPISFLDCMTSTNGYNSGKWSNKQYDQLIAKSKTVTSSSQRMQLLAKAENILMTDQGVTPLVQSGSAWMLSSKVKGLIYNGSYYFEYAYLQ